MHQDNKYLFKIIGTILIMQMVLLITQDRISLAFAVPNDKLNIGFVKNTFTAAAYNDSFYEFYRLHKEQKRGGEEIVNDLEYLTANIPKNASQYHFEIFEVLPAHIRQLLPDAHVSILTDADVHNGLTSKNSTDSRTYLYDVLILGHQEYVTQQEYSNFKKFVSDGGILIITTGNVFYTEVSYDEPNNSVTLVKGHGWEYDGKKARGSIEERWENETKQWLGSNFYPIYYNEKDYHRLYNNPFSFTGDEGGEEQYYDINNPKINVILDYESSDPKYPIAAYELQYGKGKVIVIGLAAEDIISEPCLDACQKFIKFFDGLMTDHVVAFFRSAQ